MKTKRPISERTRTLAAQECSKRASWAAAGLGGGGPFTNE